MWSVRNDRNGRYRCGCKVEVAGSGHGVNRLLPLCMSHGYGFDLRTVVSRRTFAIARRAVATMRVSPPTTSGIRGLGRPRRVAGLSAVR